MDPRLQRRIQRYGWDRSAEHYERAWQQPLAAAQQRLIERAELRPGERVIDVGCGTGLVTMQAALAVAPGGSVLGVDLSDAMVTRANEQARARGFDHVRAERMDAEQLRVPDATFDVALNALGLMYVPDGPKAVAEMVRVLAPRGRAVAVVWGQRGRCGWAELFPIVDARVQSEVCPLFFALGAGNRLSEVFRAAGLDEVETERFDGVCAWDSADDACGAAFLAGPVALAYSRFDDGTRQQVHREYLESISRWRKGDGYAVPGEFVLVSGRKAG